MPLSNVSAEDHGGPRVLVETASLSEEEWLAYRRKGIGGSDVAALLGISPWRTARDLYFDKLNIVAVENNEDNWVSLSNGDLGFIRYIRNDEKGAHVGLDFGAGREMEYSIEDMVNLDLAYATTIHKAMGSEYETVIMPLLKAHTVMLYRNLLYTGITRAKKRVILIGQKQVLFMAIHRNEIGKRNTLLGERIRLYYKAYARRAGIPIPAAIEKELKHAG